MKKRINLLILALTTTLTSLVGQDCNLLPDTIYHCGFETEVFLDSIGGDWNFLCDANEGGVVIAEFPNSYELQFSSCGTYLATYEYSNCDLDSVIFLIDDSSMTSYQLEGNNEFAYGNVGCPSGGSSCDHVISIAGGSSLEDPLWDICKTFSCSFMHISAIEFPGNDESCIVDSIGYETVSGFSQSDSCWTLNQDEFVTVDSVSGEIISNDFFDFVDSLGNILFDLGACPPASSCNFVDSTCIDSITIDTFLVPFPIHVGGQWTIIENGDTIICADTTAFTKNGIDLLLLIEPGAEYFGPGQITFSLLQIVGQDTVPVTQELSLTAWWKENFIYDTLEIIDSQVHYSEDLHCQSCGGNSFFSDYGSIPGTPDQPCSPISLSFGDPCACENFDAIITGNSLLDCNEPCTTLSAQISAGSWSDPTWSLNGSTIGFGESVTVCDGGIYSFMATSEPDGCPIETSFFVEEEILPVPNLEVGMISCLEPCTDLITGLEGNGDVTILINYPDGSTTSEPFPICEPGTIEVQVISNLTGCIETYAIDVIEDPMPYDVFIVEPGPITCENPCVNLIADVFPFDDEMEFLWSGPNGFFENSPIIEVCESGLYDLVVLLNGCEVFSTVEVFESFVPVTIDLDASTCYGSCFEFMGIEYCAAGVYEIEGSCDSIFMLNLEILPQDEISIFEQICAGEVIVIHGVEYNSATQTQYSIEEDDCEILIDLTVDVFDYDINLAGDFFISCNDSKTTIQATSSNEISQFTWYTASGQLIGTGASIEIEEPGIYQCQNSASNGSCVAELSFEIDDLTIPPQIEAGGPYTLNCNSIVHLEVLVDSDFEVDYYWSGPGIDDDNQQVEQPVVAEAGLYILEVIDLNGCSSSVEVYVEEIMAIEYQVYTKPSCGSEYSGLIELNIISGVTNSVEYRLNEENWVSTPIFENLIADDYLLEIRQSDGFVEQQVIRVDSVEFIKPLWNESMALEVDLCLNGPLRVEFDQAVNQMDEWQFTWSDGFAEIERRLDNEGSYSLSIDTECESKFYEFRIANSQIDDESIVYVPNTFSPNGDGVNDVFYCSSPYELENFEIQIYDRWGNEIFRSQSIEDAWSGHIQSQSVNSSAFSYKLEYRMEVCSGKSETFTKFGTIVLVE